MSYKVKRGAVVRTTSTFQEPKPDILVNATSALARVAVATVSGQPILASTEERDRRLAICRTCEWWAESGNLGFGKCRKCGCTRLKQSLATERCPLAKW